jgi:quercetin dioxygenase-like cupin family protein
MYLPHLQQILCFDGAPPGRPRGRPWRRRRWIDIGASSMRLTHLSDRVTFSSDKFLPELLRGWEGVRVFLLCLEPGQGLPPRRDAEEVVCYLVEGRARFCEGAEEAVLSAGDLTGAAPGAVRAITAVERAVVLWIQIAGKDEMV